MILIPSRGPVGRYINCGRVGLSRLETRGTSGGTDAEAAGDCWTCAETIERKSMFDTTATIIQSIIVPARGGVAVTSFFRDFSFKPAKNKMWLSGKIGKKGKAYTIYCI